MSICRKDHSSIQAQMMQLREDQSGVGRHKCAACAYELGFSHGLNGLPQLPNIEGLLGKLDESQAAGQRHKDPWEAYLLGCLHGHNARK